MQKSVESGVAELADKYSHLPAVTPKDAESLFTDPYSRLLSKAEIARYLKQSPPSVDRLRRKRIIPFIRVGGNIRFRLAEVERALERYKVKEISL